MPKEFTDAALLVLGAFCSVLLAIIAFFAKRQIDQYDATRKSVHSLRNEMHRQLNIINLRAYRLKIELKAVFDRRGIPCGDMEELCDKTEPNGTHDEDESDET